MTEDEFARAAYPPVRSIAKYLSRVVYGSIPAEDLAQTGMIGAIRLYRRDAGLPLRKYVTAARCDMIDHIRIDLKNGKRTEHFFSLKNERLAVSHEREHEARLNREMDARKAFALLQLGPHADVALRWLSGESLASIARSIGVHETAVYQRKTQAFRLVADQLRRDRITAPTYRADGNIRLSDRRGRQPAHGPRAQAQNRHPRNIKPEIAHANRGSLDRRD
jgi:RNA polymerase sigma factor (sigma-70 family)